MGLLAPLDVWSLLDVGGDLHTALLAAIDGAAALGVAATAVGAQFAGRSTAALPVCCGGRDGWYAGVASAGARTSVPPSLGGDGGSPPGGRRGVCGGRDARMG